MNTTKIQRYYQDSTYYIHKEEAHFVLDKLGRGECSFSDTDKMQEMVDRNFPVSHKGMQVDVTCSVIVAGCFALGQYYLVALYTIGG
jgi:hypothetical protein